MVTMMVKIPVLSVLYLAILGLSSAYNPTVKINRCSATKITLTLEGAANGGIIYIKGFGAVCKQDTVNTSAVLEFFFDACGIDPYIAFSLIVQKNPHYQTGNDVSVPIQCLYDFNINLVSGAVDMNAVNNEGINKTVRPTAKMSLYVDGRDVTGSHVDLTDTLTMSIQLGSEFTNDFDMKARDCRANSIDVVEDFCSTDIWLFPNFVHPVQGIMVTSFGAFRTTNLNGGIVEMTFSCSLQLCLGACAAVNCTDGEIGYGKRKRRADNDGEYGAEEKRRPDIDDDYSKRRKRSDDTLVFENMNVGAVLNVGQETGSDVTDDVNHLCVHLVLLVISGVVMAVLVIGCTFSVTSSILMRRDSTNHSTNLTRDVMKTTSSSCSEFITNNVLHTNKYLKDL